MDEEQYLYQSAINNLKAVKLNSNFEEIKHSYTSSKQKLKIINDKAKTILGFNPKYSIEEGYIKYISWYKNFWKNINKK